MFFIKKAIGRGRGFSIFNNSLIKNEEYVHQLKKLISDILNELIIENTLHDKVKWEYLKYNIIEFTVDFRNTNYGKIP